MTGACPAKTSVCLFLIMCLVSYISAQEASPYPARLTIPDGTPIELRLVENISSAHAHVDDGLNFIVVKDVSLGGFTVIRAGTMARGSITGVKGRRLFGIGGEVSFKLDSVQLADGSTVGLRASQEVRGRSRATLMIGGMIATALIFLPATPIFLLTRGHNSMVLKSTEVTAQIDGATSVLEAGLPRSKPPSSELSEMMDYMPPRVFDGEGREGDMVNLVFVGQQEDLQASFQRSGWVKTDKWNPVFVWHMLQHGNHDTRVPMARFYLFGRVEDYSYALPDPDAIVTRRHHLRIWKTKYTVDGEPIWAGAASYDVAIEIGKRGHLINHRIDPAVDTERDFVGADLTNASSVRRQEYLRSAAPVFEAQTACGEAYHSDSRILLLDLQRVSATNSHGGIDTSRSAVNTPPIAAPGETLQTDWTLR